MANHNLHHIRLLAALEVGPPGPGTRRVIERRAFEPLAGTLAEDLLAQDQAVADGRLVLGGGLLEPGELLRPGFPAWAALIELAGVGGPFQPQVMAIGAHRGRLPRRALAPATGPPAGALLCLPLVLSLPGPAAEALERRLEEVLFEKAGLRPPALGEFGRATGLAAVHGQLMTAADLLALNRVQLAGAGLDPFWPPVEHALLAPDEPCEFELPAGLHGRWEPDSECLALEFVTFDAAGRAPEDYALWLRALRGQCALLDHHGVARRIVPGPGVEPDPTGGWLAEPAGPAEGRDRAVLQRHPDLGLVACSVRQGGRLTHYYPLEADAAGELEAWLAGQGLEPVNPGAGLCYDPRLCRLTVDRQ